MASSKRLFILGPYVAEVTMDGPGGGGGGGGGPRASVATWMVCTETGNEVHSNVTPHHWWVGIILWRCFVHFVPERNISSASCGVGKLINSNNSLENESFSFWNKLIILLQCPILRRLW